MTHLTAISRRDLLRGAGAAALTGAAFRGKALGASAPSSPVAIARCTSYETGLDEKLNTLMDQIGGIGSLVRDKTVAVKLNLTGNPSRYPNRADQPYRNDPNTVLATAHLLARAGARRIRIIESFFPARQDMELWARYDLDINAINNVGCEVEWENVQNLGRAKQYSRVKVPSGGYIFPAYDLNHSFVDCDVFVSLSKLKNHWHAGITMTMKNSFGNTPCSLYGSDCGTDGNEDPQQERGAVCHNGRTPPPSGVPQEIDPDSPRDPGFRIPRIVTDLVEARPVHLSIVDGVSTIRGGEGIWNQGVQTVHPGLLLAGKNAVCVDTVCAAVMGYDPRVDRGTAPFIRGDNTLKLGEARGIGTAEISQIEVAGLSLRDATFDFGPGPTGEPV